MDASAVRQLAASLNMEIRLLAAGQWALLRKGDVLARARDLSDLAAFLRAWREHVR